MEEQAIAMMLTEKLDPFDNSDAKVEDEDELLAFVDPNLLKELPTHKLVALASSLKNKRNGIEKEFYPLL